MRADARRNHDLLLQTARDVFVERGPDAPLEEIARRAGVGIGTLYRRFADRTTLKHAVVLAALNATAEAGEQAQREEADPLDALAAYLHAVLDLRTSAVIPTLLDALDLDDPELHAARQRSAGLAQQLIDAAHDAGVLRKDVTFGDVGLMLVRLARPLPGPIPPETQDALAHRHADLFLAGLRTDPAATPLDGPALELADLQRMGEDPQH
jgi:AcrR family transcriptional regulator